ncbi:hypothetical protein UlMin_040957 [Ulmus minor]
MIFIYPSLSKNSYLNVLRDIHKHPFRLDSRDAYQQMKISCLGRNLNPFGNEFVAKFVATYGFCPNFLQRRRGSTGLDTALHTKFLDFDFPLAHKRSKPVIVGKWYCPFFEVLTVLGKEGSADETNLSDGVSWFRHFSNLGEETSMGLSLAVVERIKWEPERVGWRTEEFGGSGMCKKFGCYVLIERFVLKKNEWNLGTYSRIYTHQIRSK